VTIANGTGFLPGMTVEIYDRATGATEATGAVITAVTPAAGGGTMLSFAAPGVVFTTGPALAAQCSPAFSEVVIAQQFGLPVSSTSGFTAGGALSLSNSNGRVVVNAFTAPGGGLLTEANPGGTGTLVFVTGAEAIATALGGCLLSRGVPGTAAFPAPEGTHVSPARSFRPALSSSSVQPPPRRQPVRLLSAPVARSSARRVARIRSGSGCPTPRRAPRVT